jgi:phosphopantothenoylcysteine decarboxylase/phosphopantothenate--cysteine ligase
MIVANLVSNEGTGFESDENEVTLVKRSGPNVVLPRAAKTVIAQQIIQEILKLRLTLRAGR